jgi:hypothetical protein
LGRHGAILGWVSQTGGNQTGRCTASLQGVEKIIVNLGSHFSEYDAQYNEYDFDINDGSYIAYSAFGRQVRIALTNGTKAQTWKLGPKEAEEALRKNKGDRLATLVLTLMLLESPPAVDGEPVVLNARVIGYDVLTGYSHVKLGSVVVDNAQWDWPHKRNSDDDSQAEIVAMNMAADLLSVAVAEIASG